MANEIISMADDDNSSKIIRSNMSRWSDLQKEMCLHILSASSLKSIIRFKAVCPSWSAAADEITKMPTFTCLPETTWLVLPRDMNKGEEAIDGFCRLYSLDGNFYNCNTNMPEESRDAICFGSSNGWLVLLNNQLEFMLSTPFLSGIQIPLPPLNTFPDILGIKYQQGTDNGFNIVDHFIIEWKTAYDGLKISPGDQAEEICTVDITSVKDLESKLIAKAVLSSRPTWSNKDNIGVMVMYRFVDKERRYRSKLAFCTTSDHKWTKLEGEGIWYKDIMGCDNEFYVLMEDYSVDVWDFGTTSIPVKKMEIRPDAHELVAGLGRFDQAYMIKTAATGLMLVVLRLWSAPDDQDDQLQVYKLLEGTTPEWKEVESIGSNALVLGSKNSILMSHHDSLQCDGDSIYYAETTYRSCDLYVFSLKDKLKKKVCELPVDFIPLAFSGY